MKLKIGLINCLCLVLSFNLLAQNNYAVSNINPVLLENANTVIRYEKMEIDIPSISKSVLRHKVVATLLNEKSDANELTIYYNSFNRVGKIKGKIYDASGRLVRTLEKSEIKDESAVQGFSLYEDSRVTYVEVNYSDYPYTVEFEYKKTYKKTMYYPSWYIQSFNTSIENASLVVNAFNQNQLSYKADNIDLEPLIEKNGGKAKYTWNVNDKEAIKYEPHAPSRWKVLPTILLLPKTFQFGKYTGTANSWFDYGTFMYELNKDRDKLPNEMKKKVHELTATAETDREKINILYQYLQKNTRYVSVQLGIGGWQTFSAEYVSKNEYGDCKALTNFMKSMLKEIGITSYPVLIGSGKSDDLIREDFVYPRFDHVILNVPSEDYWLECTSSVNPPNYLGSRNENKRVFCFNETGGQLLKTPDFKAEQNRKENKAVITLAASGDAHLTNEIFLSGGRQDWFRQAHFFLSEEDQKKRFMKNEAFPSFTVNEYGITLNEDKPEVTEAYDIDIKRYASKGGKRLFVPLNLVNPNTYVPASTEKRIHPLHITSDSYDEDQITFNLPEGYEIESMPEPIFNLETDFGVYKVSLKVEGNQLVYSRKLKLIPGDFPAERYDDYRNFRMEIGTRDSIKLVLVKKKT